MEVLIVSILVDLYENSEEQRPAEARQIPGRETDMFDREHEFSNGFEVGKKKASPTSFKTKALEEYDTEKADLTPPESFDTSKPLHRYPPENKFYNPGASDTTAV